MSWAQARHIMGEECLTPKDLIKLFSVLKDWALDSGWRCQAYMLVTVFLNKNLHQLTTLCILVFRFVVSGVRNLINTKHPKSCITKAKFQARTVFDLASRRSIRISVRYWVRDQANIFYQILKIDVQNLGSRRSTIAQQRVRLHR